MTSDREWLVPPPAALLAGDEALVGLEATVRDFWRFALGDLRMNNARGYLAEFIVARALGIEHARRVEWDAYDILWGEITVEVKSSAYLQSWDQRHLSAIKFGGLKGTRFHARHDYDPAGRRYNAMVYVFCVQSATEHSRYDQLDLGQWEFYVIPRDTLRRLGYLSIGLKAVQKFSGGRVAWDGLSAAVKDAAAGQDREDEPWWIDG